MKPGQVTGLSAPKVPFPPVTKDITFTIAKKDCKEILAYSPDFAGSKALKFKKDKKGKKKDEEMGFFAKKAKKLAEKEANRAKSQKK